MVFMSSFCSYSSCSTPRSSFSIEDQEIEEKILLGLIIQSKRDEVTFFVDCDLGVIPKLDKELSLSGGWVRVVLFNPSPELEKHVNLKFRNREKTQIIMVPFDMPSELEDLKKIASYTQEKIFEGFVFKAIAAEDSASGVASYDRFLKSPEYRSWLTKQITSLEPEEKIPYSIPVLSLIQEKDPERKDEILEIMKEIASVDLELSERKFEKDLSKMFYSSSEWFFHIAVEAGRSERSEEWLMEELARRFAAASEF